MWPCVAPPFKAGARKEKRNKSRELRRMSPELRIALLLVMLVGTAVRADDTDDDQESDADEHECAGQTKVFRLLLPVNTSIAGPTMQFRRLYKAMFGAFPAVENDTDAHDDSDHDHEEGDDHDHDHDPMPVDDRDWPFCDGEPISFERCDSDHDGVSQPRERVFFFLLPSFLTFFFFFSLVPIGRSRTFRRAKWRQLSRS